ncbi:tensin-1-like isoform X2 [Vespula squamosa]|uniref:Tensin-1-like isoform X2 n=1 Tax=Vespula squamosa TaxID=30214 RepID=A0ABD2AA30_VESSQ
MLDFLEIYMGSFPVAIPDVASRAEFVRSQLETLRVSTFPYYERKKKKGKEEVRGFSSGRMKLENSIGRLEKAIVFSINFLV